MFIPNTEVRLLSSVPLTPNNEHQITFPSKSEQTSFFYNKATHIYDDFTYVRSDSTVQVGGGRDELYNCNYLMFRNEHFTDKWFYGFITKLEYINPNTTKIHYEIDVYQTWQFDIEFKPSFIEREHRTRWNVDGSPVVNTVDEGLDYGSEYETVKVDNYIPHTDVFFLVMVCKQRMDVNGSEITPVVNGSIQPLTYYVHPFKLDGSAVTVTLDGTPQTLSAVKDVLTSIYKNTSAVNNVVSLFVTEYIGTGGLDLSMTNFDPVNIQDDTTNFTTLYVKHMPAYHSLVKSMGDKYDGFASVAESKLLMHPYTTTIVTDLKGNHQEIKNEYINRSDLAVKVRGSIGTSNKVTYNVENYLGNNGVESLGNAIINNSPNDVPIITDLLSAYLQGNRNQLQNQTNQIAFNSVAGIFGGAMGAIGQAMARNPVGAVSGIADIGMNAVNSHFTLTGLMAKQKDLDATPPQISNMGGNTSYDYGNGVKGLFIIKKQITSEYQKKLSDYFKMFGYKVNEVKLPNLKTRTHFNFVKTVGANLVGDVPQNDMIKIKNMFDRGITLWHDGNIVCDYSVSNNEI